MIQIFNALSDKTRCDVIGRLALGEQSVSELAHPFDMALPSFMQHLRILEDAGLISTRKQGRVRMCRLESSALRDAEDWLGKQRTIWEGRLNQLDQYLITMKPGRSHD